MTDTSAPTPASHAGEAFSRGRPTGVLVLADGKAFFGHGFGAVGE